MRAYHLNDRWLWIACAGLVLAGSNAIQADNPTKKSLFIESAKVDLPNLPRRIIEDSNATFMRADNMTALLLAGGASIDTARAVNTSNAWVVGFGLATWASVLSHFDLTPSGVCAADRV